MDLTLARTNMIRCQLIPNLVENESLLDILSQVPREAFVDAAYQEFAYSDYPLPLEASGDRKMLKPLQAAWLIQALDVEPGDRVLVVGAGSGYEAALLAKMGARVYALESSAALADKGRGLSEEDAISWQTGNLDQGWPEQAPFDAILVCGAAVSIPDALLAQLSTDGHLVGVLGRAGDAVMRAVRLSKAAPNKPEPLFETSAPALPGLDGDGAFEL